MATRIWIGTDTGNEGDLGTAANWSGAALPVNADDVYFENSSQSVTAGFADLAAVALSSLNIAQSYTGLIGDSTTYMQIGASTVEIGYHYGPDLPAGSGRLKIDLGATAAAITVHNTGTPSDDNLPAVRLKCNNAATTLEIRKGKVGVACETSETSTLSKITTSYVTQKTADADVYIGIGVTLTTLDVKGGDTILLCAATTINTYDGTLLTAGSGAITTINARGGTITSNSTGTITTLNINETATVDFTKSAAARTVTTLKLNPDGTLKYDPNVVTLTNKVQSDYPVIYRAAAA